MEASRERHVGRLRSRFVKICRLAAQVVVFAVLSFAGAAENSLAQTAPPSPNYSRVNTFGFSFGYSNDSSEILLGASQNRKLLNIGALYSRRLFQNRVVNWQYTAEVLPVALESDPVAYIATTLVSPTTVKFPSQSETLVGACKDESGSYTIDAQGVTYKYDFTQTCGRRWTIGEGMSPVGFQWNFRPRHKLQPLLIGHGGYMYSTQPIPIQEAGSFNFTFDVGAGFELYRTRTKSIRVDYRYHHISDHFTTLANPGIDNQLVTVAYSFGR